jgi:hypothetical protein
MEVATAVVTAVEVVVMGVVAVVDACDATSVDVLVSVTVTVIVDDGLEAMTVAVLLPPTTTVLDAVAVTCTVTRQTTEHG